MGLRKIIPEVNAGFTPRRQLEKVLEEHVEVLKEIQSGNEQRLLEESVDLLIASANVLYSQGYNDNVIHYALQNGWAKLYSRNKIADSYQLELPLEAENDKY